MRRLAEYSVPSEHIRRLRAETFSGISSREICQTLSGESAIKEERAHLPQVLKSRTLDRIQVQ